MRFKLKSFLYFAFISLFMFSCAQEYALEGGPRDTEKPKIKHSIPRNQSVNFKGDRLMIEFDEFIKVGALASEILINPPLKEKPKLKYNNKRIEILFQEKLRENTTYTINFGTAISDITEGNKADDVNFVFSTGEEIDSLTIAGNVKDAFTHQSENDIFVMLYGSPYDSIPYNEKPYYLTKTDADGNFKFNNLSSDEYLIFALQDENLNNLFDLKNEKIAFQYPYVQLRDSSLSGFRLYAFQEEIKKVFLTNVQAVAPEKINLTYNHPNEVVKVNSFNEEYQFMIYNTASKKTALFPNKSITDTFEIEVVGEFSLDTITIVPIKNSDTLFNGFNIKGDNLLAQNINHPTQFLLNSPLFNVDTSLVQILNKDSVIVPITSVSFLEKDTLLNLKALFSERADFEIEFLPNSIIDIYGNTIDTTVFKISTKSQAFYGSLEINPSILKSSNQYIFEFLDKSDKVFRRIIQKDLKVFKLSDLPAGKYKLRVIFDENRNEKWDTGHYLSSQYPEKVVYYPSIIEIKSNWDIQIDWNIIF